MNNKINVILTFDYEVFLKKSGDFFETLYHPTERLLDILSERGIHSTFFVDILYYQKLISQQETSEHASHFRKQIGRMLHDGHHLGLHLHPHWKNASFMNGEWIFDTISNYKIQTLPQEDIDKLIDSGMELLRSITNEFDLNYRIRSFRAGGLCITPFEPLKKKFAEQGIDIESSVAHGLKVRTPFQSFDFTKSPNKTKYKFSETPLLEDVSGYFTEVPISVYKKLISDKIKERGLFEKYAGKMEKFGKGVAIAPVVQRNIFLRILFSLFVPTKYLFSLDDAIPETLFRKISQSSGNAITFLSHPKLMSQLSLEIIKLLYDKGYNFMRLEDYADSTKL